jgi:hypothetical protein
LGRVVHYCECFKRTIYANIHFLGDKNVFWVSVDLSRNTFYSTFHLRKVEGPLQRIDTKPTPHFRPIMKSPDLGKNRQRIPKDTYQYEKHIKIRLEKGETSETSPDTTFPRVMQTPSNFPSDHYATSSNFDFARTENIFLRLD